MAADLKLIQQAAELINLARGEETEDGNPLTAARHYITAMEIVASVGATRAANMENLDQKRFFLFQLRGRMEMYYERAALLLHVAAESGLVDKPGSGGGLLTALPVSNALPPALYGNSEGMAAAVMGIPMPGQPDISAPIDLDELMRNMGKD